MKTFNSDEINDILDCIAGEIVYTRHIIEQLTGYYSTECIDELESKLERYDLLMRKCIRLRNCYDT